MAERTPFFKSSTKQEMERSQSFQFLEILERKPPQHPQLRHFVTDLRHSLLRDKAEESFPGLSFALRPFRSWPWPEGQSVGWENLRSSEFIAPE